MMTRLLCAGLASTIWLCAGAAAAQGPAAQAPQPAAPPPALVKVRDDVFVIQNVNHVVAEIGQNGGNATVLVTSDGVILIDTKNERLQADGTTVVGSGGTRENMVRANQPGAPQVAYSGASQVVLGGKDVQLREV